jgi:hypothetical protein
MFNYTQVKHVASSGLGYGSFLALISLIFCPFQALNQVWASPNHGEILDLAVLRSVVPNENAS